jgi:aminopeptidase N
VNGKRTLLLVACVGWLGFARAEPKVMNLAVGDPARKHEEVSVEVDAIVDTRTGKPLSPGELGMRLGRSRLVFIGEQHADIEYHRVELRALALLGQPGRPLVIGLEMFPVEDQPLLDAWVAGRFSETEFVERVDWYGTWGFNWGYYREILLLARAHGIPLVALRMSEAAETKAREEAETNHGQNGGLAPAADFSSEDHRTLLKAFFGPDEPVHGGLSKDQFEALFEAQCRRDAFMARAAAEALETHPDSTVVVLAGIGHVLYDLGIARQLKNRYRGPTTTIVPATVEGDDTRVRASIGDYVWGVPARDYPAFPELGAITTRTEHGLRFIDVESDSPAERGGLKTGDVLTRFKNAAMADKRDLSRTLATVEWGDWVAVTVLRDGEQRDLTVRFQR